ncbi:MAG: vitamin B12 dependent-methionine synthase activation domain-containing protein [Bacteroidales bacterium]|nr:vitamin B12 dependent-methionine synthase activation domain-containing protein [Bacteroidales bacterium]MDT8375002.1 vitamin B12 dependent-methionine synthase activation domain-containing protein [Bacteroidales bacterium]
MLPSVRALERAMGYPAGNAPGYLTAVITEVFDELIAHEEIRAEYRIIDDIAIDTDAGTLTLQEVVLSPGLTVTVQIREAEKVALFVCTAGATVSDRSRCSTPDADLLKGYVYDVTGTIVVENAADMMLQELRRTMEAGGYGITNRFSPGYCGWDMAEQHKLFIFLRDNYGGVTLTESALMKPVKSVSGIIGIGRKVRFAPYSCSMCDDKNCLYRGRKT